MSETTAEKRDDGGPVVNMTMRDVFAAQATQAFIYARASSFGGGDTFPHADCAKHSVAAADALIAELNRAEGRVNAHDDLLAACKAAQRLIASIHPMMRDAKIKDHIPYGLDEQVINAAVNDALGLDAAITKAEGRAT